MVSQRFVARRQVLAATFGMALAGVLSASPAGDPRSERADWFANGEQIASVFGWDVSIGGDVNGDGYDDAVVGAPFFDSQESGGMEDVGAAYLYLGSPTGLEPAPSRRLDGSPFDPEEFGSAVAIADVNGDGYGDVVVGRPSASVKSIDEGAVSVDDGSPEGVDGFPSTELFRFSSDALFGTSVATPDANGDGIADVLVGAPGAGGRTTPDAGAAFLYLGSTDGVSANEYWFYFGDEAEAELGFKVNDAGDVNGDGADDILVGAWKSGSDDRGLVLLFLGGAEGISSEPDWVFAGGQPGEELGVSVSSAGDVDGDGFDDVVVGAWTFDGAAGEDCGRAIWFRGGPLGLSPVATTLAEGDTFAALFGRWVAPGGDVNGDGYDDVVVGAPFTQGTVGPGAGRVYVFPGSPDGLLGQPLWILDGTEPIMLLGASVASGGDVNADGFSDVIAGAYLADGGGLDAGRAELVLGGLPTVSGFGVALDMRGDGSDVEPFFVTITYVLQNLGNGTLTDVDLANDLDGVFGFGNHAVVGGPRLLTDSALLINTGFDGSSLDEITIAESSSLFAGEIARIEIDVEVFESGTFSNQLIARCVDADGVPLADTSTAGELPDPDESGVADEAVPTTLTLGTSLASRSVPDMPLARWHLWSVPLAVETGDEKELPRLERTLRRVFDRRSDSRTWLAFAQTDSLVEDPVLLPGQAYWVNTRFPVTSSRVRGRERPVAELALVAGWNGIGCPSGDPAPFATIRLRRSGTSESLTLGEASDLGLIDGFLRRYVDRSPDLLNNGVWRAESVRSTEPDAVIPPWGGRLLRAFEPLVLSFGASGAGDGDSPVVDARWSFMLTAQSGDRSSSVELTGVAGATDRWDVFDVASPPAWSDEVQLAVIHADWGRQAGRFERSAVDPNRAEPSEFALVLDATDAVTLTLGDRAGGDLEAHLVLETGVAIDLRRARSVAFEAGTRTIGLRIARAGWTGPSATSVRGGLAAITPTVSAGPFAVRYEITRPTGDARVIVYDIQGRMVREVALATSLGTGVWTWDARDDSRRTVAPGRYILEFVADGVRERRSITVLH